MANENGTDTEKTPSKFDDKTIKLYVGGISASWDSARLKGILGNEGIKRVDIVHNYAFAFVEDQSIADRIIEQVSGKTFDDSRIVIQVSKNKQNLPNGDNLCFECGKSGHWAKECAKRQERYRKRDERSGGYRDERHPPPSHRGREPYSRPGGYERDPYARAPYGDPYARDPYARDPYARDPYSRDPYPRDPYSRDPYIRDPYARDPYARDPYARDPYGRDPYVRDPYYQQSSYDYRDEYPRYRDRSPTSYRHSRYADSDPYAEERRRLAYGTSSVTSYRTTATTPSAAASTTSYDYSSYSQHPPPPPSQVKAAELPSQQYQQYAYPSK